MNRSSAVIFKFNEVLLYTVNMVFTFVGIFLNSVVIMSLLNSQLRGKLCYFMILVLACFDLAVVVVCHPLIIVEILLCSWIDTDCDELEKVWQLSGHLFVFSLTALLTMTVERYLALVYPFFHQKFTTRSRLMVLWVVFQLPLGIFYFLPKDEANEYIELASSLALTVALFLLICGMNIKLFFLARTLRQRMDIPLGSLDGSEQRRIESTKSKGTLASLRKISTCLLAVVCLFICYSPSIAATILELTYEPNEDEIVYIYIYNTIPWALTFLTLNSSLNCLIFFYKNNALRRYAKNLLRKCRSGEGQNGFVQ